MILGMVLHMEKVSQAMQKGGEASRALQEADEVSRALQSGGCLWRIKSQLKVFAAQWYGKFYNCFDLELA